MKTLRRLLNLARLYHFRFVLGLPSSLYFNLRYFGFMNGIKLPVILSNKVRLIHCKGTLRINSPLYTGMILWGFTKVNISPGNEISLWNVEGDVVFDKDAELGVGSRITVGSGAKLSIGSNFRITSNSTIACYKDISFGNNNLLSWDILIMDTDSHNIYDENRNVVNPDRVIIFGDNVWIGCRCLILKGAAIPSNTVIGANTIVNKKYSDQGTIIAGYDSSVKKTNVRWRIET